MLLTGSLSVLSSGLEHEPIRRPVTSVRFFFYFREKFIYFYLAVLVLRRSQWPRGLRRGSAATR